MRRSVLVLALLFLGVSGDARSARVTFHVLGACAAAGPSGLVVEAAGAILPSVSVPLAIAADGTWTGRASFPAGYYVARARGCRGGVRFAVGSQPQSVALVAAAQLPVRLAGGAIVATASMPGLDAYAVRIGEKRGPSMRAEGATFYADDLAPGTYAIWVHFKDGNGFSQPVTVDENRVAYVRLDTSRYFGALFAELNARRSLVGLAIDASGDPWFVEDLGVEVRIGHLLASGRLREFPLPRSIGGVWSVWPMRNGGARFMVWQSGLLGHIGPDGREVTDLPFQYAQPDYVSVASDESVWTWSSRRMQFSRAIPASANAAEPRDRTSGFRAFEAIDATRALAMTDAALVVGKPDGTMTPLAIPWGCVPSALVRWSDGTAFGCASGPYGLGFFGSDGMAAPIAASRGAVASDVVAGSDAIWAISRNGAVVRIDTAGTATSFDGSACGAGIIARASGSKLWLVDLATKCAVVISATGAARPRTLGALPAAESDLVAGNDGRLWFLDAKALRLAAISPDGRTTWTPIRPKALRMMP